MKKFIVVFTTLFLAGCGIQQKEVVAPPVNVVEPTPVVESVYAPTDPIEIFLVELAKATQLPFENPVKADIFWNEGETSTTLKTFFGDSFLIRQAEATLETEKVVADYLVGKGFTLMKFNGSIGDDSRKMGYRKDDLICKTDFSIYPDETTTHLVVYCSDAAKGTLRK